MMQKRIEAGKMLYKSLISSKRYYFSELIPSDLGNHVAAVYAIFYQGEQQALYVGRTKNIRQRMYKNHLMGPTTNARLKKYLVEDDAVPEVIDHISAKKYLQENCYFQYISEPEMEARGRLEGLFSYLLNVRYIHEEH